MAPSTRLVYSTAQHQFVEFCTLDGSSPLHGSVLPASELTLMRFCLHLDDRLHHTSIKVYLSMVRFLHIDKDFSDSLVNCLQLQRLLRGIRRHQGSYLPVTSVTSDLILVLPKSLDLQLRLCYALGRMLPWLLRLPQGWGVHCEFLL